MLHKDYLEKQAREMYDTLIKQMKITEAITEQLKEKNQLEWAQMMIIIQQRAREIVCKELICVWQ